ncbi:nuclear transport factor 2 domain-containing protein [Chloropicon primus]|uniref:Nuclear transport factor 2 domain-containing protein n=1 Tax=Chloropicon primus TaxID=1764295 RepID=A0A5B8MN34_9CHLO|nr:nuclear transport factor 2 domain-containing protein [Chloropicon primus]UPR01100.1 nuclear transport factor 2 domain-containing protein [Chloropicon primus]|mmetsp:Transcript_593/g.1708  ORF Transcript_593/g.1708 Transcript_593/m.1708 type:complete len:294 (+) Transcript_593:98-979(+)|eukprot:QDZ21879.1 nuclear transport factor 2 domain-containing protein [Chloropicon primus]
MATAVPQQGRGIEANRMSAPAPTPMILESKTVATQFVKQYYHVLSNFPATLHRFYTDASTLSHSVVGGETMLVQTQRGIHEKVVGLGLEGAVPQILSVDAQTSLNGGVVVHTTGFLTLQGTTTPRPFAQVFFLAQQEHGYYVLNDLFCWLQKEVIPKHEAVEPKQEQSNEKRVDQPKEQAKKEEPKVVAKETGATAQAPAPEEAPVVLKENRATEESAPAAEVPMTYAQRAAAAAKRISVQVPQSTNGSEVLAARNWGGEEEDKKPTIIKKKRDKGKGRGRRDRGDRSKSNNS